MNDFQYLEAYLSNGENSPTGEWISFPTTAEHMQEVFDRIGMDGVDGEWQITEYRSDISGLAEKLSRFEQLDELNYLGKLLEMKEPEDREKFAVVVTYGHNHETVRDMINLLQNLDCYDVNSELSVCRNSNIFTVIYQGDIPKEYCVTPAKTHSIYYPINEETARRAKEAISFDDYRPGSATAQYRQCVDRAVQLAEQQKKRTDPMYHEKIDRLLDTYARKLAENLNHRYAIHARVPSMMITGPANFPVRKHEKQMKAFDTNMQEWKTIQGLLDKIRSTGMGGISADDQNAIQKLEDKLEKLKQAQETMKAVNAYYRKYKTLDGCPDLTVEQAQKLKESMSGNWRASPKPFESFSLSNNNAEIRRVQERINTLTRQKEIGYVGWKFDGGTVEANMQDNRLQIFFEDKPDAQVRSELKNYGFRWAPSVGAWQRQLNDNAIYAANHIQSIQPITGERPTEIQSKAKQQRKKEPSVEIR